MAAVQPDLAGHPDRLRWNARYSRGFTASRLPHPLAVRALSLPLPDGPVLDLASGPSGSVLLAAAAGRRCVAVDASDVALDLLGREAARRRLSGLVSLVHADLGRWRPEPASYALVLCTGYWDRALLADAALAVLPGGLLGWEAFTEDALRTRPHLRAGWCLAPGEPASLLPDGFLVLCDEDLPDAEAGAKRRVLARAARDTPLLAIAAAARPGRGNASTRSSRSGRAPAGPASGRDRPPGARCARRRAASRRRQAGFFCVGACVLDFCWPLGCASGVVSAAWLGAVGEAGFFTLLRMNAATAPPAAVTVATPTGLRQRRCLGWAGSSRLAAADIVAETFGATVSCTTRLERSTRGAAQARVLSNCLLAAARMLLATGLARSAAGFS